MSYSERRQRLLSNIRTGVEERTLNCAYWQNGTNDYATFADLNNDEFIFARYEIEEEDAQAMLGWSAYDRSSSL